VPHEHSRLATPESDLTTCSFKKHDAGYNLFEGDPHQVLTVAKAWHYLISIVIRISLQLPSCDLQLPTGRVSIHCALSPKASRLNNGPL
jgi:hypothetical protein